MEIILRQLTGSEKMRFMKAFWLELITMKKEKQQILTEFLLEWLWVECKKEQAMEKIILGIFLLSSICIKKKKRRKRILRNVPKWAKGMDLQNVFLNGSEEKIKGHF